MATNINEDWEKAVNTTYAICKDQVGRKKPFVETLTKALKVEGLYQVDKFFVFCTNLLTMFRHHHW